MKNVELILGQELTIKGQEGDNFNTIVIGPPGCGKTFSYMIPNLLKSDGCSMVVDDKKGNIYKKTAVYFKSKGYKVFVFDVANFKGTMQYNPFEYITNKEGIMKVANFLVSDTSDRVGDRFWQDTARLLCASLIEIGQHEYGKAFNMRHFMKLLGLIGYKRDQQEVIVPDKVDEMIKSHKKRGLHYGGMEDYQSLRESAPDTWRSIVVSLRSEMLKFNTPQLLEILDRNSFDTINIAKEKSIIYVVSSDTDSSMYPIVQLMYQDITSRLMSFADCQCDENANLLPLHIKFFIDDFASGVQQKDFENVIANCRSRNISYMICIQSISQLEALYGRKADTIIECANYKVFYGTSSYSTADYISRMINRPIWEIQKMSEDTVCILRRGECAKFYQRTKTLEMEEYQQCIAMM